MRAALFIAALLTCSSCTVIEQPAGLIARWTTAWKDAVTVDDRQRLAEWRSNFISALDAAKKAGFGAEITREGALLNPDAALGPPALANGFYRCRMIKLGTKEGSIAPAFASDPPFICRVKADRGLQKFNKFGSTQRYVGLIFPGDSVQQVFLGTLVLGDETRALQYGQDQLRDVAGYVERIGPNRWRLIMPRPHFQSQFAIMELVPSSTRAPERERS